LEVSSPNQRSTRLSYELEVGREVPHEPGVRGEPVTDGRRLVRGGVVEHEMDIELGGHFAVEGLEELLELDRAVPAVQRADDLAASDVKRGAEARRP